MPVSFPSSLDSLPRPSGTDKLSVGSHSQVHGELATAIEALEEKVGIDGSADPESLDHRVAALEGDFHTHVCGETPTGLVNGSNTAFTLTASPSPAASLMLFLNGILQRAGGHDFALVGAAITFTEAPPTGSVLLAHYIT